MPPPERLKGKLLHSLIENGQLDVTIKDYHPRLLGTTVEEASWRLLHRVHEGIINARSTTIPIGTSMAASSTNELRLKIGQAHTIGPALSVDDDRMGATVIAAADDQPARAVV